MAADCVTMWVGDALGPVERACLRSVLRQGHRLALYCYRTPTGIPSGVEVRDAHEVIPESKIFFHSRGSLASFSDWFRYELLRRGPGTWIDTDMYLLRPIDGEAPYLFGEEEPGIINNAVLRLPSDSPMISLLLGPFESARIPSWVPLRPRFELLLGQIFARRPVLPRLPWGTTGPLAVNAIARRLGLSSKALPPDVFYPVSWRDAAWITDPAEQLGERVTGRTVGVHLWNHCIKDQKNLPARKGSFLARLQLEGRD